MDDDPSTLPSVSVPCPACTGEVMIDVSQVVQTGVSTGLDPRVDVEPWRTLLDVGTVSLRPWGRSFTLVDDDDLQPYVVPVRCPSCRVDVWAVAGWSESQPARYRCVMWPLVTM